MPGSMTDDEVERILTMPKRIGEQLRWRARKDDRPYAKELRAGIVPYEHADFDRELILFGEYFQSRRGTISWSVGMQVSGMKQPLVRIDNHANPHHNSDGTKITGCMMHRWSVANKDRNAVPASDFIDCSHVHAALMSFLIFANIELLGTYDLKWEFDAYGRV